MVDVAGAVLTGGRSVRFGRDKALLRVGGVPLAARVAAALTDAGATRVITVGGDAEGLRAVGLDAFDDPREGSGPLGGVATALRVLAAHEVVVVLACDLVGADPVAIRTVVDALGEADVAVPRQRGHLEPLHAAWRPAVLPTIEQMLEDGRRAVHEAIGALHAVVVDGIDPRALANVNTPGEVIRHLVGHNQGMTGVPEIDVDELAQRRDTGVFVLDVRQPQEYETFHVPGAVLIPLDQLGDRQDEIPRDEPLLVICHTGARSGAAVQALTAAGYDAANVVGGMVAWIDAGFPVAEGPAAG